MKGRFMLVPMSKSRNGDGPDSAADNGADSARRDGLEGWS
jgi:hypothetical protein